MPLEIIGHPRSNFVRAVRMVALEKGVAHEHTPELPHSDVIKTLHPMGQIPAMRHDGLELFESMAIARYIDEVFDGPKMVPTNLPKQPKLYNGPPLPRPRSTVFFSGSMSYNICSIKIKTVMSSAMKSIRL